MAKTAASTQSRRTAVAAWLATTSAIAGGIAVLHALGARPAFATDLGDLWTWIGAHSPERVLLGLGRLGALGLGYWLLGSLLMATAARAVRLPALTRSVDLLTLPALRRVADRLVAVSLAVSSITASGAGMAMAAERPTPEPETAPVVRIHRAGAEPARGYIPVPAADAPLIPAPTEEDDEATYTPVPAAEATAAPQNRAEVPPRVFDAGAADRSAASERAETTVVHDYAVVPGDNLWDIAERHLERILQRTATESETATYWAHLIETNRSRLRSGNPDLIYPGELVVCPAATDAGLTP